MTKSFLSGFVILFLAIVSVDLPGQESTQQTQSLKAGNY